MTIIWCTVSEIKSTADIIFCYFSRFFALIFFFFFDSINQNFDEKKMKRNTLRYHHFTQVHQKLWCYNVSQIWRLTDVILFFILGYFFPFTPPPNDLKNQNFSKMKTLPGDIIILHMCTKNYDPIMYDSWDMMRDGRTEKITYRGGCPA